MTTAKIDLTRGQAEFLLSSAKYRGLFAGYGFGKSHLMGLAATMDATHSSSAVIGIYEPYHDLIRTVAMPNVQKWCAEFGIVGKPNKQDGTILTSNSGVGDFQFKTMENVDALVGYETYTSHLDELDTMSMLNAEKAFFKILGRNRQQPDGVPEEHKKWNEKQKRWECINKISVYTTPEGYRFCYKMWSLDCENARNNPEFKLFKGRTQDNPTLSDDYIEDLKRTYPKALLKAYMEGEFVNLESGTVYYNFCRKRHNTIRTILPNDVLHIGIDFNKGFTCGIVFVDDENITSIVAEIVKQRDTPDLIKAIKSKWPEHKVVCYPDNSGSYGTAYDARPNANQVALLKEAGFEVRTSSKNPRIENRVSCVVKLLEDMRLFVNVAQCPEITRCMEQQAYNDKGEPDKNSGLDHPLDGMGYRINKSFPIRKPVFQIPFSFIQKR